MSTKQDSASTLSRRTFLIVALGTLPAAAVAPGPLSLLWPRADINRPVDKPWILARDGYRIWDPEDAHCLRVPTLREWLDVPEAPGPEQDAFLDDLASERDDVWPEDNPEEWQAARDQLVRGLDRGLDEADLEQWYGQQLKDDATATWWELPDEVKERFPINLTESDHPGASFTYLQYKGELDDLNRALATAGLSIHVIEKEQDIDVLFPGDPEY